MAEQISKEKSYDTDNARTEGSAKTIPLPKVKYEICVCCGVRTNVKVATPIEHRTGYIIGAGQMCPECYENYGV